MKNNINKPLIFLMIITLVFIIATFITKPLVPHKYINESGEVVGLIKNNYEIKQEFTSELDEIDSISIKYANYQNKIENGTIDVNIYDESNNLIYLNKFKLSKLDDNQTINFDFDIINNAKGKKFYLELKSSEMNDDDFFTLYATPNDKNILVGNNSVDKAVNVIQSGAIKSYSLTMLGYIFLIIETMIFMIIFYKDRKVIIKHKKLNNVIMLGISFLFAVSLLDCRMDLYYSDRLSWISFPLVIITIIPLFRNLLIAINNKKIEDVFLALAIPIGTLFWLSMIPLMVPDEEWHANMILETIKGNVLQTQYVSKNFLPEINSYEKLREIIFQPNAILAVNRKTKTGGYSQLLYIPAVIGVFIGKALGFNYLLSFYIGSYCSFLFFLIVGYYIVKNIPLCKIATMIYLLNPMNLQQVTSLSCDAVINMASLGFITYVLYLKFNKDKLEFKNILVLSLLSLIVILSKFAYFPLVFLLLLLKDKLQVLKTKKKWLIPIFLILLISASYLVYSKFFNLYTQNTCGYSLVNLAKAPQTVYTKIAYLLHNPFNLIYLVINTIQEYKDFYIFTFAGNALGRLEIYQPTYLSLLYYLILAISIFMSKGNIELKQKEKRLLMFIWVINMIVVFGGLYMGWGNVRDIIIEGVQGRYFIPFNILIMLILYNKNSFIQFKDNTLSAALVILFIDIVSICYVMSGFLTKGV